MRFDRLVLRGIGPFRGEARLDLEAIAGPLVAISGENGAGKSVLLEALAAACFRKTPTRGTLGELATTRDAFCEVQVTNGHSYIVRQTVDAHTGKGESLIADAATGAPIVESGKRRDADRWIAEHLPAPEVLYSSTFGAQGSGGFLDLDPAERKRVILRVLGHEHLEELSRAAGEKARAAKGALDTCMARLGDEERRGEDVAAAEAAIAAAREQVEAAEAALDVKRETLTRLKGEAEAAQEARSRHTAAETRLAELRAAIVAARARLGDLQARKTNNEAVLADGDAIRAAAREQPVAEKALADARAGADEISRAHHEAKQRRVNELQLEAAAKGRAADANARADRLGRELADAEAVEAAVRDLPTVREEERLKAEALEAHRARLAELSAARLNGKERRIEHLRTGLTLIAGGARTATKLAQRHLDEDDQAVLELEELPTLIADLESVVTSATRELDSITRRRQSVERTAGRADALARFRAERDQAWASARGEGDAAEQHRAAAAKAAADIERAGLDLAAHQERVTAAQKRVDELEQKAKLLPRLDAAQARIDELRPQIVAAADEIDALEGEQLAVEGVVAKGAPALPDLREAEHALKVADGDLRGAQATLAVREAALEQARKRADRVAELAAERTRLEADLADWRLLERDLGRNGVQALELDSAGPELTELANDLLHHCLGPRFSVRVESTRPSADGKKDLEGCFVFVNDAEANREAEARTFSGGERVLVGEAINLAVTMLGVRHAGMTSPTLVRDETGAALDAEKGRAYIAMLRRAADLVGAHRVLFVSHDEQLQEMADARVRVAGGRVEVC